MAVFSGRTLSLPNFSHSLDNFQGTVTFVNKTFSLQSLTGEMGGGKVEGNGQLIMGPDGLQSMTFNLQGKDLRLYPMDRTSCLVNPNLTLRYEQKKLLLSGTLAFQAVEWQREIDERIVFSTRSELSTAESKIREMLGLDIALTSENILMQNSLGRIRGRFKLRLTGTASFPILTGTCEGNQGEILFSDRPFHLLKAKLVFNNKILIDPLITIESEAFIQNYRIRFDIRGSASRAKPELTASPPLPPQDILALISLGEVFKRSRSTEVSVAAGRNGHGHEQADRGDPEPGQQAAGDQPAAHRSRPSRAIGRGRLAADHRQDDLQGPGRRLLHQPLHVAPGDRLPAVPVVSDHVPDRHEERRRALQPRPAPAFPALRVHA